jgi:hypothetical protein
MRTRRELFFLALFALSTGLAPALPEKTAALEVTYYYLPG